MKTLNEKLGMLQQKMRQSDAEIRILIVGLGSVGLYLLDYLVSHIRITVLILHFLGMFSRNY